MGSDRRVFSSPFLFFPSFLSSASPAAHCAAPAAAAAMRERESGGFRSHFWRGDDESGASLSHRQKKRKKIERERETDRQLQRRNNFTCNFDNIRSNEEVLFFFRPLPPPLISSDASERGCLRRRSRTVNFRYAEVFDIRSEDFPENQFLSQQLRHSETFNM